MITVGGKPIKSPQRLAVGIYDVSSNADRNAQGTIVIDRVATKRKLEMEWGALTNTEISAILSAVTDVFFTVSYPDPQTGASKTITCYVGDRTAPMARYVSGAILWEGLKMNFIEQ